VVTAKPGVATELLHHVVAELDDPRIRIVVSGFGEQADMVRDGRAEVALVSRPFEDSGLEWEELYAEPRVAALPAGHELAAREVLQADDLAGLPAPRWKLAKDADRNYWAARPEAAEDGPVVQDSSQLLEVVAFGQAIALVPRSMAERNVRPDIAYRPVTDVEPYRMFVVWPAGSRSTEIRDFVAAAIRHSDTRPPTP
jgi:DNA-binding transcriptional LysR family regulator